jgi:hypothetical protein
LDNRVELCRKLAIDPAEMTHYSDTELILYILRTV